MSVPLISYFGKKLKPRGNASWSPYEDEFSKRLKRTIDKYFFMNKDYQSKKKFLVLQKKWYVFNMSKRYSGKSFKDSNDSKKPKLSLKEKRKQKKEKTKKT